MSIKYINNKVLDIVEGNGLYLITINDVDNDYNQYPYIITTDSLDGLNSDGTFTGNIINKEIIGLNQDGWPFTASKGAYGNGIYLFVFLEWAYSNGDYTNSISDGGRLLAAYTLDGVTYNWHYLTEPNDSDVIINNNSTITSELYANYYHPTVDSVEYVGSNEFICSINSHALSIVINPDEVNNGDISDNGIAVSPEFVYNAIKTSTVNKHSSTTTKFGIGTTEKYGHTKVATDIISTKGAHSLYTEIIPTEIDHSYPGIVLRSADEDDPTKLFYTYSSYYGCEVGTLKITNNHIEILDNCSIPEEYSSSNGAPELPILITYTNNTYNDAVDRNEAYVALFKYSDSTKTNLIVSFNKYAAGTLSEVNSLTIPISSGSSLNGTKISYSSWYSSDRLCHILVKLKNSDDTITDLVISFRPVLNTCSHHYTPYDIDATYIVNDRSYLYLYNPTAQKAIYYKYSNGLDRSSTLISSNIPNLNIQSNIVNVGDYLVCMVYNEDYGNYSLRYLNFSSNKISYSYGPEIPQSYLSAYNKCTYYEPYVDIYPVDDVHLLIDYRFIVNLDTGDLHYNYIPELSRAMLSDNNYIQSHDNAFVNSEYLVFENNHDDYRSNVSLHVCGINLSDKISDGVAANAAVVADIKKDQERVNLLTRLLVENKADTDHRSEYSDGRASTEWLYGHVRIQEQVTEKISEYTRAVVPTVNAMIDYIEGKIDSEPALSTVESSIDPSLSSIFSINVTGDVEITVDALPTGKVYKEITLFITNGGSFNVTFGSNIVFSNGFEPILTTAGTDVLKFVTIDGGESWFGKQEGQYIH